MDHVTPIGELPLTVVENGLGPVGRDRANGGPGIDDGDQLNIDDQGFDKGLGVYAPSWVRLYPEGKCNRFVAHVGVDQSGGRSASVVFRVLADGVEIYDSGRMSYGRSSNFVDLDLSSVSKLDLIVNDSGDGNNDDAADWADAGMDCHS